MSNTAPVRRNKKNRVLTAEVFDTLLDCLGEDRHQAALKYEELHRSLIGFFAMRGVVDPEELADETLNRVAHRLAEGQVIKASNPASYVLAVARNIYREQLARPFKLITLTEFPHELPSQMVSPEYLLIETEQRSRNEEQLDCLTHCLAHLSETDRSTLTEYHQGKGQTNIKNRQAMAQRFGVTLGSLRNRISRIRDRVANCTQECVNNNKNRG